MKAEPVQLEDGAARQGVTPGVRPLSRTARQIAEERRRRNSRRGDTTPSPGFFAARPPEQEELFR